VPVQRNEQAFHYIPGVGPLLATALAASVADPKVFKAMSYRAPIRIMKSSKPFLEAGTAMPLARGRFYDTAP